MADQTIQLPQVSKQRAVLGRIKRQIINGELPPGGRLPTREELEKSFGVSTITVQRALDELVEAGFVRARGRAGTFVVENPPHLCRYGMVFPAHPGENHWSRFWAVLARQAEKIDRQMDESQRITFFYGLSGNNDSEDYRRLVEEVQEHCVAGLIFAASPHELLSTPILTTPGIPRVAIMAGSMSGIDAAVYPDWHSLMDRAVEHLMINGCTRVAVIWGTNQTRADQQYMNGQIREAGMTTRSYWNLGLDLRVPQWAQEATELLMNQHQTERPDGLIIMDDHLVPHVLAGLETMGVSVPDDLRVVAHGNFPDASRYRLAISRLGFDAAEFMRICTEYVGQLRQGKKVPPMTLVPAVWETTQSAGYGNELVEAGGQVSARALVDRAM